MRFLPVRPFVSLFFFIAVLMAPHAAPAEEKFTLEQVMSAPFVSELTAAPAAGRVAWIANEQGRRNIWVAQPGSHASAQQITHYTQDDGQEISGLAWSADGEWLAYTRGGDAEWPERPAPNPALGSRAILARDTGRRSLLLVTWSRTCHMGRYGLRA